MMLTKTIFIIINISICLSAYSQSDTTIYNFKESKKVRDKSSIKHLRLYDLVSTKKSLPSKIRGYKNLEILSLRPIPTSFARPSGGGPCIIRYSGSRVKNLPDWISELEHLKELDLIGINLDDESNQIKKLEGFELEVLSIDPIKVEESLINSLTLLKSLKVLKIRARLTEEQLEVLRDNLKDCEIITGIYADY